jgi:Rieske Fe-S protein
MFESAGVRRRSVLAGCGVLWVAALAGCTAYGPAGPVASPAPPPAPGPAAPAVPAGEGSVLAAVADVPVGGGVVLDDRDVVVTQPVPGTFRAFSATCTHQGCTVRDVADGTINGPCHGSSFAVADGSVTAGPATTPLPAKAVAVLS